MRVPLSWLAEFVDIKETPEQIAEILTNSGIEVDAIEFIGSSFTDVVVAEVLEVEKHPEADKLCVAKVFDGSESLQIVCGASNCRKGLKVALAKVGARLKSGKIGKSKLRGVESYGMLCSSDELGLPGATDGIIELAEELELGLDLSKIYAETIFEVSLTPNLGHCSSILGIAREFAAATKRSMRMPKITPPKSEGAASVEVSVKNFNHCGRYACRVVENITVKSSPDWMQRRLTYAGFRPVNNIVDVTNYVLMELGHPLHAFDLESITGNKIVVRAANKGETFVTLDEKRRSLTEDDLLICDQDKALAIAGVMGGLNSEIKETTQSILIESAYFNPQIIRMTSQRLGLQTDSSKRFERAADPNMVVVALDYASSRISELLDAVVFKDIIDQKSEEFSKWTVEVRLSRINKLLGTTLSASEVESTLSQLGFKIQFDGKDVYTVVIPTYRPDLRIEEDLIEEVARLYGYNNIGSKGATYKTSTIPHSPLYLFEKEIRTRLCREGLQEFLTCDLISPNSLALLQQGEMPQGSIARVLNPTSEEQSVLRTSLLPGFLETVKYNQDRQIRNVNGFEIGRIYYKTKEGFGEQAVVGIVLTGSKSPHDWKNSSKEVDFYDLKGILENLLDQLDITDYSFQKSAFPTLHSGRQASVRVGKLEAASFGEVHPSILRQLSITQRVFFAEINLHELMQERPSVEKMKPLPKYPGSERDWTITLDDRVEIGTVVDAIKTIPSNLLESVSLKSLYYSDKIGKEKKNATFHFIYRDLEKTVSLESVEAEHARIISDTTKTLQLSRG